MKLKGKRVLLSKPEIEKSQIHITPDVQDNLDKENMKKWTHLVVFAVGEMVENIEVGDVVYAPKGGLERSDVVGKWTVRSNSWSLTFTLRSYGKVV